MIRYRPMRAGDVPTCARVLKAAIDDYSGKLNQPAIPADLGPVERIIAHVLATDPERAWVGVADDCVDGGERVLAFANAYVRGGTWYLAALMVHPSVQAAHVGSALMDRAQAGFEPAPGVVIPSPDAPLATGITSWGMSTDALQPISNALYAKRGIIARVPAWRMGGEVRRWSAFPRLPAGLRLVPFEAVAGDGPTGAARLEAMVAELDQEVLGFAHPQDHGWMAREGRVGFLAVDRGDGRAVGYAYGSGTGRVGPVAATDPALHPSLIGVAIRETPVLGPVATWVLGSSDEAMRALLDAGLRYDGPPGLFCWSHDRHPFRRYLPAAMAII